MIRFLWLIFVVSAAWAADPLSMSDGFIRLAPPGAPLAGYGVLHNHSDKNIVLVEVNATWAGMTMMHESREENGVAKMRHLDSVTVPAHGDVQFKPGGMHLMFMQTPKTIKAGDVLDVVFESDSKQQFKLSLTVQSK